MNMNLYFNSRIGTYGLICHDIFAFIRGRRLDNDSINGRIYLFAFTIVIEELIKMAEAEIHSLSIKNSVAFADTYRIKRLNECVFQLHHMHDEIQRELKIIK